MELLNAALLWADILVAYALFVMQNYLTQVWGISFTDAARILNIWNGIAMALPAIVLFFRDAYLGNRFVLLISSWAYCVGMGFVTLSVPSVLANPCKQLDSRCVGGSQKALFYTGMGLIALGMAGNEIALKPFLEHQTGQAQNNRPLLHPLQILGLFLVVIVAIIGAIGLPYIKPWKIRFGIPAICALAAAIWFLTGFLPCWKYTNDVAPGSPVTTICGVFVACFYNTCVDRPHNNQQNHTNAVQSFRPSRCLSCLERAASPGTSQEHITIETVEDAKIAVRMVFMWLPFIICGMVSSFGNTYFVEQANNLDRHMGKWKVPLPILLFLRDRAKEIIKIAAASLVKDTNYSCRSCRPPTGIAIAMVLSILCCVTAAKIEHRRLNAVRKHGLLDKPDADIPMSVYWLLFQFFLLAGVDAFFEKSVGAFYSNEAPDSMKDSLEYLNRGVFGLGFMSNALSVYVVEKTKPKWFQKTLNKSRLDKYYWLLSVMSSVNLLVFVVVASCYRYKNGNNTPGAADQNIAPMEQANATEQNGAENGEESNA